VLSRNKVTVRERVVEMKNKKNSKKKYNKNKKKKVFEQSSVTDEYRAHDPEVRVQIPSLPNTWERGRTNRWQPVKLF
jgi:hypothetical protein